VKPPPKRNDLQIVSTPTQTPIFTFTFPFCPDIISNHIVRNYVNFILFLILILEDA